MFGKTIKPKNNAPALISRLKLGSLQDWLSVVLVFLLLMIAVLSIEQAHWVSFEPSLILTLVLAVLMTSLMIILRLWNKVTYFLMVILGLLVMVWQSSGAVPRADGQSTLNAWWQTVTNALPSENSIYFAMFLIIVTWLISFLSVWFILKKRNVWVAVFLGAVMLLANINNLPYDYYFFFPLYLFVSLLLIFQVNLAKQKEVFKNRGDRKPLHNVVYLLVAVFFVVILIVNAAWFSPEPPVEQIGLKLDTSSLHNVDPAKNWFNIFASIQSKWPWMESKNQAKLMFETPLEEGESIHYIVTSDKPAYWLTRRYDTYNPWGWTSNSTADEAVIAGTTVVGEEPYPLANTVNYIVENRIKTDVIITAGQFVMADIPVSLKTVPFDQLDVDNGADVIAVVSPWVLGPYQRYTIVTSIPSFTAGELTAAKGEYPDWVTQRYLQLPDTFPQHVKTLSNDLTKDVVTPYEKLTAIKKYLDKFQYNQKATIPSGTEDGVALFLYSTQKGNCLSFASSMVVMLRSVGIPARLCTGYLQGDLDKKTGKYIVRSRHYHAWAEVYFPGNGWIEFETTPDSGAGGNIEPADDNASFIFTDELPPWMQEEELLGDEGLIGTGGYVAARHSSMVWIFFVVLGVLFFIAVTARTVFSMWVGQLKRIKNPSEAYARMCYLATLSKAGPNAQETPLEYSMRLAAVLPGHDDYIGNITQSYINVRYSPRKEITEDYEKSQLQKSWIEVCSSLVRRRLESKKWFLIRIMLRPE
jgi:transglutaminase-like putative cysteine protease/preprotein translocase subunit SecG